MLIYLIGVVELLMIQKMMQKKLSSLLINRSS